MSGENRQEQEPFRSRKRGRHAWVPDSAIEDQRMSDGAFRVYFYLVSLANPQGNWRASAPTIARALGEARSTVMEHLSTLERLRHIRRHPAFRADGGKAANRYWVSRDRLVDVSPPHVDAPNMGTILSRADLSKMSSIVRRRFCCPSMEGHSTGIHPRRLLG
jgi:Helix-turn-helix domain